MSEHDLATSDPAASNDVNLSAIFAEQSKTIDTLTNFLLEERDSDKSIPPTGQGQTIFLTTPSTGEIKPPNFLLVGALIFGGIFLFRRIKFT